MTVKKHAERVRPNARQVRETLMRIVFLVTACISILAVILICIFMFANGIPTIAEIGPANFLLGTKWKPLNGIFGILPMIVGSLYVTAGAVLIGVPVGILCAVYLARFCSKRLYRVLKPLIDLLAGIPSIVYGFFGLVVIVPLIQQLTGGSNGKNILTASLMLGIMILPTIISVSESAIRAVALGATHERSVFFAVLPAAKSGILAGVILGIGRAIGEATAVKMVAGNQPILPTSILSGVRTLTSNIVVEMGYAEGLHREALIATAVVLFVFILLINLSFSALKKKEG